MPSHGTDSDEEESEDWHTNSDTESLPDEDSEGSAADEDFQIPPLLPVPTSLAKPTDSLCAVCTGLELTPRRFVVLPGDPETGDESDELSIQLGRVEDIKAKPHCPFCRLVLTALGRSVPSYEDGEAVSVYLSWNTDGKQPDVDQPWIHIPQIRIIRPYAKKESGDFIEVKNANLFPEITLLANDSPTSFRTFFIRLIDDQIDFNLVRNWLTMCELWHGSDCDKPQILSDQELDDPTIEIPHFRLIDVNANCITKAPRDSKYVTLSYVWGQIDPKTILRTLRENVAQLEEPGGLLRPEYYDKIPATIRDAMEVVRELGLRYLWADTLCIIQDDEGPSGSKMGAIAKMDLVYSGAYLTILAATGTDAHAGLPGLWPGTRGIPQPVEEILPGLRLAFKPKYQDYINYAVYTIQGDGRKYLLIVGSFKLTAVYRFQERQFTKRNLIFIGGQVVF